MKHYCRNKKPVAQAILVTAITILLGFSIIGCALHRAGSEKTCDPKTGKVTIVLKEDSVTINLVDEKGLLSSHEFIIEELDNVIRQDKEDSLLPLMKLSRCPVCCSKKADFRECFKYCLDSSKCCDNGNPDGNCTILGNE